MKKKLLATLGLLVIASMILTACGGGAAAPTSAATDGPVLIRWSVGAGTGADPAQIPIENEVVADFNASQDKIKLVLEIIPNASAQDTLSTYFASGAGPDIVGPIGWVGSNTFQGQWLDIGPMLEADKYDTSKFEPALVSMYQSEESGTIGLPFAVYPSAIYYNTDLFEEAGINPPPAAYGEQYEKPDGTKVDWDWEALKWVAQNLTIDANGNNALSADFDKDNVVQFGFSFQWEDKPSYWGTFWQSGPDNTFLVPGGEKGSFKARIPAAWMESWQWYYDGMYGDQPYVPNGALEGSADFNSGNSFASGKIAMANLPSWYLCCIADLEAAGGHFDFGAAPSYDGKPGGRVDADTFRIWKGTPHPQEAYEVVKWLVDVGIQKLVVGSADVPPAYGAIPSDSSLREPWLAAQKAAHPSVKNWDLLIEGLNYADVPSAEGYMPNMNESWARTVTFANLLKTTPNLDLAKESETFRSDLEVIFNK